MDQKYFLRHFIANTLDVSDATVIDKFLINDSINLNTLLNHSIVKLNVLFTDFWNVTFGTFPTKKDFQDLLSSITPLNNCFTLTFDLTNLSSMSGKLENIIRYTSKINVLLGNDAQNVLKKCISHFDNPEHVHDVLKAKWSYRFNGTAITNQSKLLNVFIKQFMNKGNTFSSTKNNISISNFAPKNIHFDDCDDTYMTKNEKIQYILYKDNRFLVQLASHFLIVSVGLPNIPKHILEAVYSVRKKNEIVLYIDRKLELVRCTSPGERFMYDISLETYKMLPRVAQNMLLMTNESFAELPLCKTSANCIFYSSQLSGSIDTMGKFDIVLTNNSKLSDPQNSIYFMPSNDADSILMNHEVKKAIWKMYLSHQCPFKFQNPYNNILLFNNFIALYLHKNLLQLRTKLDNHGNNVLETSSQSYNTVVIIDTRFNMLSLVSALVSYWNAIKNCKSYLWRLHIFTSKDALNKYKFYTDMLNSSCIEVNALPELDCDIFHMEIYNQILKDASFWKRLENKGYKKCLIVQDDGMLVNGDAMESYMQYDYVGAPWLDVKDNEYIKVNVNKELVGNGGFSLRDVSKMREVCENFDLEKKQLFYHNINEIPEDVFFVECLVKMGANIASFEAARKFAVEQVVQVHPMGFHKFWSYHHPKITLDIFNSVL